MKIFFVILYSLILSIPLFALKIEGDTVVDTQGNKIELKEYNKIVVIDPAVVEIIYLIGGENKIAAIANTMNKDIWPMKKTRELPGIGTIYKPSIEKIISYEPDLVILNPMISGFGKSLKERGIPYIVNNGNKFEEILDNVQVYGKIVNNQEKADLVAGEYRAKLRKIEGKLAEAPLNYKGAFLFSTSPMMAFNSKSLPGQVFEILGIKNIADNLPGGRPILSSEYIVSQNPDILLGAMGINKKEDILNSNPVIMRTTAGKKGNIAIVESSKILRPTPRIIDVVEELYEELRSWN